MYASLSSTSTSWFGARTIVGMTLLAVAIVAITSASAQSQDNCKIECYPNTKMINGKGGVSKSDNCRWILRTDGKPARLCDHIKCRKVCPNNQAASSSVQDQQEAASGDNLRIEQQLEGDAPLQQQQQQQQPQAMGIMRQMHGNKLSKAPVPGVAGGRLSQNNNAQAPASTSSNGRRMAPTLPPAVQYDENDTPPPISRFLDISPEE